MRPAGLIALVVLLVIGGTAVGYVLTASAAEDGGMAIPFFGSKSGRAGGEESRGVQVFLSKDGRWATEQEMAAVADGLAEPAVAEILRFEAEQQLSIALANTAVGSEEFELVILPEYPADYERRRGNGSSTSHGQIDVPVTPESETNRIRVELSWTVDPILTEERPYVLVSTGMQWGTEDGLRNVNGLGPFATAISGTVLEQVMKAAAAQGLTAGQRPPEGL